MAERGRDGLGRPSRSRRPAAPAVPAAGRARRRFGRSERTGSAVVGPSSSGPPTARPVRLADRAGRRSRTGRVLGGTGSRGPSGRPVTAQELRLLADLLDAGVPLLAALRTLVEGAGRGSGATRLRVAAAEVARGGRLAGVLGAGAPHVGALVAAGEQVGRLSKGIAAAADLEERLVGIRRRIVAALAYPALVLAVAIAVVGVVITTVVPQMAATLGDLGSDLPLATRVVVRLAAGVTSPVALSVPLLLGVVVLGARRRAAGDRDDAERSRGAAVTVGGRSLDVAVGMRVLATLLAHGVPLVVALGAATDGARAGPVRTALAAAAAEVARGRRLTDVASFRDLLAPPDLAVLVVGEDRGLLAVQLARVADRRLAAVERRLEMVATLAEPLLVLVVGAVVGGVVAALYLPSFRVLEVL